MLINRESDYALRILRTLSDGEKHAVSQLCEYEDVPQQFCYKILKKLSDAGYLATVRGVGGGCVLTTDLRNVTLLDLMEALDCERYINACLKPGFVCDWKEKNCSVCSFHNHMAQLQASLDKELRKHSIHDMLFGPVSSAKKKSEKSAP